jgi:RHS repeat-associated protein
VLREASTSTTANQDGSFSSTIQYTAFGEIRVTKNTTLTKYRYTGQPAQAELGLDYYVARWYDPVNGHFTQADTLVPEPGKASSFDRYAYVVNNPIRNIDPSGHTDGPYSDLLQMAIDFFSQVEQGAWKVVGDPLSKSPNTNGADMVFSRAVNDELQVLCVEIKDLSRNVDLGSLGKSEIGLRGGSIEQNIKSASRFVDSLDSQLKMESKMILENTDNLQNAIFTNAKSVSTNAMKVFDGVYTNARDGINSVKPIIVGTAAKSINTFSSITRNLINAPVIIIPLKSILDTPFMTRKELGLRKMDRAVRNL